MKQRSEVAKSDKWNVEALYPNLEAWQKDLEEVGRLDERPRFPEILEYKGILGKGASTLKEFIEISLEIERRLSKLYTYAHMRYDEDLANEAHKKANTTITQIYHDFAQEISFAEPELLALSDETIASYLKDPTLSEYHFYIEKMVRAKPHTLSEEQEKLLAMAGMPLSTPSKAFGVFNNADLKFPDAVDEKGNANPVTHAKYLLYLRGKDRELRKNAFQSVHRSFASFENTVCELINGQVQNHLFSSRVRHFPSCLDAALFPNQIDASVYTTLVETVRKHLPILHGYMEKRKKALKLDELHMYDLHVPLVAEVELKYDYATGEQMVIDSVAPLGEEYQKTLRNGLLKDRWVDRYENQNKRSGAYSSGCYDSMPYILMNYQGAFHDLMTLAHEAGHSMHSFYSHKHQPYQYGSYSIFVAEVASTFNEELVFHKLLESDLDPMTRAYLINQKIEDIRSTFFRQTMFAEFELEIHKLAEQNIPLTPGLLKERYRQLNLDYFGPAVTVDEEIDIEWARIPHFYYNFYVYQYATGISAAHSLFERVMTHGEEARDAYLGFLSSGSSKYPLDILEEAGVNMRHAKPIESTIQQFDRLVQELFTLI